MTQKDIFSAFMKATWGGGDDCPDYDIYSDANVVAAAMGGKQLARYSGADLEDEDTLEWLFPDGSTCLVITDDDNVGKGVL